MAHGFISLTAGMLVFVQRISKLKCLEWKDPLVLVPQADLCLVKLPSKIFPIEFK
jgi:hypothetical protein